MKRLLDIVISAIALTILSPFLGVIALLIFSQDGHSPFYSAPRIGRGGQPFRMLKFRSMIVGADRTGVTSTSATDVRITPIGHFVRRHKLDEFVQLCNVLRGDMSLVGPRPNVESGTRRYTVRENLLLTVRPGITDFASIVFSDEGEILRGHADADAAYDSLIRPWKSRLGLFYVDVRNTAVDVKLLLYTAMAIISRPMALRAVSTALRKLGAPAELIRIALREDALKPGDPPT